MTPEIAALIGALGGALIGSLSTVLITWLTNRKQIELQKNEIKAQVGLKARELLFNSYQQRMNKLESELFQYGSTLGQISGTLAGTEDEEERHKILHHLIKTFRPFMMLFTDTVVDLESELEKVGLLEKREAQLNILRENSGIELDETNGDDLEQHLNSLFKSLAIISLLNQEILNRKCESLFGEYVSTEIVKR
jgi:hypothetical protein